MYGNIIVDNNRPCAKAVIDNRLIKKLSVDGNDIIYEKSDTSKMERNFYKTNGVFLEYAYAVPAVQYGEIKTIDYFRYLRFKINYSGDSANNPVKQSVYFYVYNLQDGEENPNIVIEAFPELYYLNKLYYRLRVSTSNNNFVIPNNSNSGLINGESYFDIAYENGHILLNIYDAEQGNGVYDLGEWDYNRKPLLLKAVSNGNSSQVNIQLGLESTSGLFIANYNTIR